MFDNAFEYDGLLIEFVPTSGHYDIWSLATDSAYGYASVAEGPGAVLIVGNRHTFFLEWSDAQAIANFLADLNSDLPQF